MKNKNGHSIACLCLLFTIITQTANAQGAHKRSAGASASVPAKENYIAHEITKSGPGDHGIFYDTLRNKILATDPVNARGRQYQDIKVTLGAGDVIRVDLNSTASGLSLTLLNTVNGHLSITQAIIDTSSGYNFRLSYKTSAAGIYTLRVTRKNKVSKDKYERQYYYANEASYQLSSLIAVAESGMIADNPEICDQVQFLLRQRLTDYMQITGNIADTTMDVLDRKKIGFVNHHSMFSIYKNSPAKISFAPNSSYVAFDQALYYKDDADAAQAHRYFIESFRSCLGQGWSGRIDPKDAGWYKFENTGHHTINIILYPGYKYVQILM